MITRVIPPASAGEAARDTVAESRLSRMSGPGAADSIRAARIGRRKSRRPRPPARDSVVSPPDSFLLPAGVERISAPAGREEYPLKVMQDPNPANQLTLAEARAELCKMPWLRAWFARKMLELDQAQEASRPVMGVIA